MRSSFDEFIDRIPKNIHSNTKSYVSKNIAIFIPEEFLKDIKIKTVDYHFVIFHTTPPTINLGNIEFQFKKGSFICIKPGIEVEVNHIHSTGQIKFISIGVKKDFFENIASQIINMEKIEFKNNDNAYSHQILDLIEFWIKEIIDFGENCPLMIESIEKQLIIQLMRDSMPEFLISGRINFTDNDYIDQSIRYMQKYYSSNITINEICNTIYISSCHFQRIFKKQMEQTPYSYLMGIRVDKAKEKLINDHAHIEEIARLCGFVSTAHFSSVFKRMEGISPSEYRKNNLKSI
ncbi:AraC family transcriptional regulator [Tissierella sp.]|uniref:helix-turn-helix transcriptional regulator n=1 Tax=Tissierella sp. TaxID=41274 RepID=UPI002858598E|nr:AraC family transcriptional regulator [Tissierella sp.]MDR7855558.1 AraC family transcriptional regulator [Tissierella sp.]